MSYQGPERRRHRMFVTKNTEYHLRDTWCVAVRDTRTGRWRSDHAALGTELAGSIGQRVGGRLHLGHGLDVPVGSRLCFTSNVTTSPVRSIERPPIEAVRHYLEATG